MKNMILFSVILIVMQIQAIETEVKFITSSGPIKLFLIDGDNNQSQLLVGDDRTTVKTIRAKKSDKTGNYFNNIIVQMRPSSALEKIITTQISDLALQKVNNVIKAAENRFSGNMPTINIQRFQDQYFLSPKN